MDCADAQQHHVARAIACAVGIDHLALQDIDEFVGCVLVERKRGTRSHLQNMQARTLRPHIVQLQIAQPFIGAPVDLYRLEGIGVPVADDP